MGVFVNVKSFGSRHAAVSTSVLPAVLGADMNVPLADGTMAPFANFDHAATAPCLEAVADAVNTFLPWYTSTHRGAGTLSAICTAKYEESRITVRQFIGCRPDDHLVFTRNTTDALNMLARIVPEDTTTIVFAHEHHAGLLPWRDVRTLPIQSDVDGVLTALDGALAEIGAKALVVVTGATNVTGELLPLEELVAITHRHGARIAVDAAQLVAHRPIDMTALDVDYLAFSGHKLYAPFGIGVLAGRSDWFVAAEPYLRGGGATVNVGDDPRDVEWSLGVPRHEAGTPNVIGAVALAAACETVRTAWDSLIPYESVLLTRLRTGLAEIPEVNELSLFGLTEDRIGIVSFTVDGVDPGLLATALSVEYGIGLRQGRFCAHPLTRHLLRKSGTPGSETAVRASLGLGVDVAKVDRLVDAIRTISEIGLRMLYVTQDGTWWPTAVSVSSHDAGSVH
ncbi:aminotransferase class V-fold PLP-dependent enzyme [Actinosynnema sp. NPDC023658]|uniref:aminotransferase class V-fold PLP-dependent enzyme n=1 Tax=Actinosynnema sp. NPDC023658 TaxID=3155465 RepID=UPI0033D1341C